MLQQGVGIYIASSEDVICGLHKNPNPNSVGITDATYTPPTSTYFIMNNGKDGNFKHEELLLTKSPPIIRPLSSIDNEVRLISIISDFSKFVETLNIHRRKSVYGTIFLKFICKSQNTLYNLRQTNQKLVFANKKRPVQMK